ncbi:MAG: hypothetical protein JW763_09985 [candidate division Zixibacteria bacterium]|nr:hypothetical protein [candidate division Zixibacteria bacterium]
MDESIRELLYRSFDISLSVSEQKTLDQAVIDSPEFRRERQSLIELRALLAATRNECFHKGMVERVMTKLFSNNDPGKLRTVM